MFPRALLNIAGALMLLLAGLAGCRPEEPVSIPLDTSLCLRVLHHSNAIPHATLLVKYNTDSFPGYDRPASYFDARFTAGADGRGCLAPVPEGRHWVVAFGYDSLYIPHDVYGSFRAIIDADTRPKIDTVMYVSE